MATEKRLIDANELLRDVDRYFFWSADEVRRFIATASTVDAVEVVHGHKIVRSRCRGIAYAMECPICLSKFPSNKPFTENVEYCSVCGKKLDDTFQNYCPNCGAKMDGDGNG